MGAEHYEQVLVTSRAELRAWLEGNADRPEGVWLITYNKGSGKPFPTYDEIVEEALCFGWIDSTVRQRDGESSMLLFTPRKPNSTWSAVNKRRLEHLLGSGRMTPRGLRAIEVAKANGSWSLLDEVERLEVPEDLAAALSDAGARETWDTFPPGARKQMLWALVSAKRPQTRRQRLDRIVAEAVEGRRAWG
jgi:uncharacterized protein YdeI (YjbR/CyaY-like superfamily)